MLGIRRVRYEYADIRRCTLCYKVQSHYSLYARIRSQTLIYDRDMLGIRRVRYEYADMRRCTLCYTQIPNYFLYKIYQRMRAYRIYVTHTLAIRAAYAG